MAASTPVTLRLEVALDAEPVAGVVSAAGAESRRFSGWTELFVSLDAMLAALRRGSNEDPDRGHAW
jgi:hypothetical protein